jgi:hypothetical protein
MIQGQGRRDISLARECHERNSITQAFLDKFLQHILSDFQPVGRLAIQFEVFRFHTAGKIKSHDDIDAAGRHFRLAFAQLWPGQSDDAQGGRQPAQVEQNTTDVRSCDPNDSLYQADGRIKKSGRLTAFTTQPRQ